MKTIRNIGLVLAMTGIPGIIGCAAAMPPQDLVNARTAYNRASRGPAPAFNPADLHTAKEQLDVAEASFREDGDTQNTRDQAYVAVRKTELAETVARTKQANQSAEGVVSAMHEDQKKTVAGTAAELGRTKSQIAAQGVALVAQGVALKDEKARREEAEKRAAQAAADLAKFARSGGGWDEALDALDTADRLPDRLPPAPPAAPEANGAGTSGPAGLPPVAGAKGA